jgi:hypothetical protein
MGSKRPCLPALERLELELEFPSSEDAAGAAAGEAAGAGDTSTGGSPRNIIYNRVPAPPRVVEVLGELKVSALTWDLIVLLLRLLEYFEGFGLLKSRRRVQARHALFAIAHASLRDRVMNTEFEYSYVHLPEQPYACRKKACYECGRPARPKKES